MTQSIKLIVADIDGTLLNSAHQLTDRTANALRAALAQGVQVVLATGKTRNSSRHLIERLGLTTPGIYLQGLAIYNPDGSLAYQQTLDPDVARQVFTFAEDRGFSVAAYSGTHILVRSLNAEARELTETYHEPPPDVVGPLHNIVDEMPIHKVIAIKLGEVRRITALRWQLSMQLDGRARLTQALDDMLEILPPGASKGTALRALLKMMGIPASQVMAIGDGENDIEMVELAGVGVAMGNGHPRLKAIADFVTDSNDEDGVAVAVEKFIPGAAPAEPSVGGVAAKSGEAQSE